MPEQRAPIHSPTVSDVARRARVSRATVSRVLNRYPHVRPEVRARVERAMAALAYRPDEVARSLARRETRTLGLVVTDITNPFYAETAAAIVKTARAHGYTVILCDTDNSPDLQEEYIEVLRQRRVDGIILGSVFLRDPAVERLIDSGMPCMLYNRRLRSGRGQLRRPGQPPGGPGTHPASAGARPLPHRLHRDAGRTVVRRRPTAWVPGGSAGGRRPPAGAVRPYARGEAGTGAGSGPGDSEPSRIGRPPSWQAATGWR